MSRKRNKPRSADSLTQMLAKAFLAVSVAILLLVSVTQIGLWFHDSQNALAEQQRLAAAQAGQDVTGFIREKLAKMEAAVQIGDPAVATRKEQRAVLDRLLGLEPAFCHLLLLDSKGKEMMQVARLAQLDDSRLANIEETEVFAKIRRGERHIGDMYVDEVTREPRIIMAVPVLDVFGVFQGSLLAEVNLKFMWNVVDGLEIGRTGVAYVVDRHGDLIAFGDTARVLRGERMDHLDEVREFISDKGAEDQTGADIYRGINDAYVVGTYVSLGEPDWAVIVELPVREAYRQVGRGVALSFFVLALAAVLARIIGLKVARRLTIPLLNLTDTASRIAEGEMHLQADREGPREVVSLATAFNNMTSQLREMLRAEEEHAQTLHNEITQRRQAQDALVESEQRFRSLVTQAADAFFLATLEGHIVDVNQQACDTLGYTRDELLTMTIFDIDIDARAGLHKEPIWEKLVPGQPTTCESYQQRKDGSRFPVESRLGLLELGGERYVLGLARDITERRQAEAELARHRDQLEDLVQERTAELAEANQELKEEITEREQAQDQLRRSLHELERHNNAMIGRERRILELKSRVNTLLDELKREPEFGIRTMEPTLTDGLRVVGQREQTELECDNTPSLGKVKRLQALLENFCQCVGIAAAIVDLDGNILVGAGFQRVCSEFHRTKPESRQRCIESDTILANQMAEGESFSMYTCKNGLTDAAAPIVVRGEHVANFFVGQFFLVPPDLEIFRKQAAEFEFPEEDYLQAIEAVPVFAQKRLEHILGFLREFAVQIGSMEAGQAELSRANLALRDNRAALLSMMEDLIEARENAEEYAREAQAASQIKSEFLANMSHEIRTPMTAILGFADLLLEAESRRPTPSEGRDAIDTIKRNGEYLLGIINDVLDLSKVEAGKMTVERLVCHPCRIIAEVVSLMRVRAASAGLAFDIEYTGPIPETIETDPTRLRQILVNLIGNAIKFTQSGSVKLITGFIDGEQQPLLCFDVVDTGIGMTQDQAERLFKPFTQADATTTRRFGGTGLGLSISKRMARLLGGDIRMVESQAGEGSRFRVTISTGSLQDVSMIQDPLSVTTLAREPLDASVPTDPKALAGYHILVAEDGPDNQRLIKHILGGVGAHVDLVENGKRAVDEALSARDAGEPFDIILMDMQMPVMDGYEATRVLRRAGYGAAIIALTAHAMITDRDKCLKAGCNDYAVKPINRRRLIDTIRKQRRPALLNAADL